MPGIKPLVAAIFCNLCFKPANLFGGCDFSLPAFLGKKLSNFVRSKSALVALGFLLSCYEFIGWLCWSICLHLHNSDVCFNSFFYLVAMTSLLCTIVLLHLGSTNSDYGATQEETSLLLCQLL